MKWVHNKSEVPSGPHFAIIEFTTITTTEYNEPYPHQVCNYIVYECEGEWKNEVSRRTGLAFGDSNWVAVKVTPATVKTTVNVSVE